MGPKMQVVELAHAEQLGAVFGGGLAEDFLENAVEVGQGLESNFEGDFADAQIRIQEQVLGILDANARQVIGEIDAGDFFKHFTKVKGAGFASPGHMAETEVLGLMLLDVFLGAGNDRGFGVFLLDKGLVAQHSEVLGKDRQEADGSLELARGHNGRIKVSAAQSVRGNDDAPLGDLSGRALELAFRRWMAEDLAGLEEADEAVAQADGHRSFAEAVGAAKSLGFRGGELGKPELDLKTGDAGTALFGDQGAEWSFMSPTVMGQLPAFGGAQSEGQTGGFGKGIFEVLEDFGIGEGLDQATFASGPGFEDPRLRAVVVCSIPTGRRGG
jgi:hypothetical protein